MKNRIKARLARLVEIIAGRRCENCKHNRYHVAGDTCKLPWRPLRRRCQCGIYPIGWEKEGRE